MISINDSSDDSMIEYEISSEQDSLLSTRVNDEYRRKKGFAARHVLGAMGFLGFANIYAMRVNLSVAIVAMVNTSAIPHKNTTSMDVCPNPNANSSTTIDDGEFAWTEYTQGLVLGSFFWGYMVTNLIGGRLAENIGGKKVFFFGTLGTAVLTLLTPIVARCSVNSLIFLRVLMGLTEGVTFPSMNAMLARWIPPLERSQTNAMVYAGSQFGIFVSLPICGMLCHSSLFGGWPSVFYVFGTIGLIWCFAWILLVHDSPSDHPFISKEEKDYIHSTLNYNSTQPTALPIPFKEILTSMPIWAGLVGHVCQNWGFYFLLTELPSYMKNILHFDIKSNSYLTALPFFLMWAMGLILGFLADYLRSRRILSTTSTRRIFNSIAFYTPMVCLILIGYVGCNATLIVILFCIGVGMNGGSYSGYMNCHLDLASNYAGTLMGFTNFAATIPGFLAPYVTGALLDGQETISNWRILFWLAAVVYFIGNTFYVIFISGEEQIWNKKYVKDAPS